MNAPATVQITLIDADTGTAMGQVALSPSRLPEHFGVATTLHIGGDPWEVVSAEPSDAAGYLATGALQLSVRLAGQPLTAMDSVTPNRAPFQRASLVDPLPDLTDARPDHGVLELPQDAWRQIELVTDAVRALVALEVAAVEAVARRAEVPGGYHAVHVRRLLSDPLSDVSLSLSDLQGAFRGGTVSRTGVAFRGRPGVVAHGFAFETAGRLTVYGTAPGGRVTVLGLLPDRTRRGPPVDAPTLSALRRAHGLLLVDWDARVVVPAPSQGN